MRTAERSSSPPGGRHDLQSQPGVLSGDSSSVSGTGIAACPCGSCCRRRSVRRSSRSRSLRAHDSHTPPCSSRCWRGLLGAAARPTAPWVEAKSAQTRTARQRAAGRPGELSHQDRASSAASDGLPGVEQTRREEPPEHGHVPGYPGSARRVRHWCTLWRSHSSRPTPRPAAGIQSVAMPVRKLVARIEV